MSVKSKVGLLGLAALALTLAVTRYDYFNEGGRDRHAPPVAARQLTFTVTVRRYLVIGNYDDPRSPIIHWAVGSAMGSEAQRKTSWSRNVGKVPAGTYYALYVQPGRDAPAVVTQEVTVLWGGVIVCGPTKTSGSEIPRCEGRTG